MSEKITFKELVKKISQSTHQSEQTTNSFIHELAGIIESGLEKGEKITVSGFGKFELRWMDERKGRNPQTGEEITIPGQNKIYFKPYKDLREHVNQPYQYLEPKILEESPDDSATASMSSESDKNVHPDASIDDLIRELPSPVKSKIPTDAKKKSDPDEYQHIFSSPESKTTEPGRKTINENQEHVKEKSDRKKFYWTNTAVAIVILMVIFVLFFWMLRSDEATDEIALQTVEPVPTEQLSPPAERTPSAAAGDADTDLPAAESHSISSGETLWSIAGRSYGDPYLWPIIFEHNSDKIENPDFISTGSTLDLPKLSDSSDLTEKDRQTVARGYLYVYDWMTVHQPDSARYFLWAVGAYSQEELQRVSDRVKETDLAFATQR